MGRAPFVVGGGGGLALDDPDVDVWTGKVIAHFAGLDPANYADIDAVADSQTAMNAIADSQTAMDAIKGSSYALEPVLDSPYVDILRYEFPVLADAPVLYWRFEEGSGTTVADETGNGHSGAVNGADLSVTGPGDLGSAVSFDGSDDYVSVPLSGLSGEGSLEAWINLGNVPDGSNMALFHLDGGVDGRHYLYATSPNGSADNEIRVWLETEVLVGPDIRGSGWRHVVLVNSGSTWRLFLDATEVATASDSTQLFPSGFSHLHLGSLFGGDSAFLEASCDEVAVYDYPLSASQIQTHYDASGV